MAEEQGVTPDSPAGIEAEGSPSLEGNPVAQGSGRSVENLHGEFTRKHNQLAEKFDTLQGDIRTLMSKLAGPAEPQQAPQAPVSPFGAPRPLQQFSDEYITQYLEKPDLTPYQRQVLVSEQQTRNQLKFANQIWDQRREQERVMEEKQRAVMAAEAAFPALRDKSSEFSQRVQRDLQSRRQRFGEFPTDVYDVANNVAREMGIGEARAYTPNTYVASGPQDRGEPRVQKPRKHELTEEDVNRIGSRLADALPSDRQGDGKMKRRTFNKQRIKDRSKLYAENADLYKHTKLGGDE